MGQPWLAGPLAPFWSAPRWVRQAPEAMVPEALEVGAVVAVVVLVVLVVTAPWSL